MAAGNAAGPGELATLLVAWRRRLRPEDVGMPGGSGRRVPGLRRAEVAVLAGISTDYLERLEQGRSRRPRAPVLETLARVLRLSEAERDHLFRAAQITAADRGLVRRHLPPGALRLMERLGDLPVGAFDAAWGFVTGNRGWDCLFGGVSRSPGGSAANLAWLHFTGGLDLISLDDEARVAFERALVSDLRAAAVAHPADPDLTALVARLRKASGAFADLWSRAEVVDHRSDVKTVLHPLVGPIDLDCDVLHLPGHGIRLVVYTAAPGSEAAGKLDLALTLGRQDFPAPRPGG